MRVGRAGVTCWWVLAMMKSFTVAFRARAALDCWICAAATLRDDVAVQ